MTESTSLPAEMHVRVKRRNTVLFLYVEPSETIHEVKEKIETLLGQVPDHIKPYDLFVEKLSSLLVGLQPAADQQLKKGGQTLENNAKLSDLSIQLDDELFLLYRSGGSWEAMDTALDGTGIDRKEIKA